MVTLFYVRRIAFLLMVWSLLPAIGRSQMPLQKDSLIIHYKGGSTEVFRLQQIRKIFFDTTSKLGLSDPTLDKNRVSISPNPARSSSLITISIAHGVERVSIFDERGAEVRAFSQKDVKLGSIRWRACSSDGTALAKGRYFISYLTPRGTVTQNLIITE